MKKYIFTIFVFLLTLFCILFPESMIDSTKNGLSLWWKVVLPSLFPFLILSNLITKTAIPMVFGKVLNPVMKFIFNLPGICALPLFLGMTGGYPIGAKITSDLRVHRQISRNIANRLIAFTNNSGPLFITGAIGIELYGNKQIGTLLLLSHYISALLISLAFRFENKNEYLDSETKKIDFEIITLKNLGTTLTDAVKNGVTSVVLIGGFIVLFSIISTIMLETDMIYAISNLIFKGIDKTTSFSIISGILEVTNGVNLISNANISLIQKLIITSILLGFGGFSIHAQTLSVISKTDIKTSYYLIGKTLQGVLSGVITYLLLIYTNFSKILLTPVFNNNLEYNSHGINMIFNVLFIFTIFISVFKILQELNDKTKKHKKI